jgi:type IX secretion system PorP/SprF family membrane protein
MISTYCLTQNTQRFSQFNFASPILNPSTLNLDAPILAEMIFRNQWMGFEGGPTTFGFSGQYEINQDNAVGLTAFHDRIGVHQMTSLMAQYAYRVQFGDQRILALGGSIGIDQKTSDFASISTIDAGDVAFANTYSKIFFNAGAGLTYYTPDFYVGLSIPQFLQNNFRGAESGFVPPRFHYYLNAGAFWGDKEFFVFNPHVLIKATKGAPIQGDIILRNTFKNVFSIVVGYRTEKSLIGGFDFMIVNRIRLGISANYDIGTLSGINNLSSEIYLGIGLPFHDNRDEFFKRKIVNSRGGFRTRFSKTYRRKNGIR